MTFATYGLGEFYSGRAPRVELRRCANPDCGITFVPASKFTATQQKYCDALCTQEAADVRTGRRKLGAKRRRRAGSR
jgi:hypothetical protein